MAEHVLDALVVIEAHALIHPRPVPVAPEIRMECVGRISPVLERCSKARLLSLDVQLVGVARRRQARHRITCKELELGVARPCSEHRNVGVALQGLLLQPVHIRHDVFARLEVPVDRKIRESLVHHDYDVRLFALLQRGLSVRCGLLFRARTCRTYSSCFHDRPSVICRELFAYYRLNIFGIVAFRRRTVKIPRIHRKAEQRALVVVPSQLVEKVGPVAPVHEEVRRIETESYR